MSIRLYNVPIQGHHRVGLDRRRGRGDFELLGDGAGEFLHLVSFLLAFLGEEEKPDGDDDDDEEMPPVSPVPP